MSFIVVAPIRGNPDGNILDFTADRELRSLVELAHNDVHLLIGAKTRAFQLLCRKSFWGRIRKVSGNTTDFSTFLSHAA